jgi:hypothetical protein
MKNKEFKELYVLGRGELSVSKGCARRKDGEEFPSIGISRIDKPFEIGEVLTEDDAVFTDGTIIVFESLESLEVVQRAIDACRKKFLEAK